MGDQREAPLADAARAFLDSDALPFTTPGHKRAPWLADALLREDLPLYNGADDARLGGNLLGRAEALAAELWGADRCRFSVAGSTHANQALALACAAPGRDVVVTRTLHKSLLAGLVLSGARPVWVRPEVDARTGLPLAVTVAEVEAALARAEDPAAVVLVEPSYVGVLSDLPAIAAAAHAREVPLLVDQAWGAYLGHHPALPAHALQAGADALVTSVHKTLPAFTQAALLLARGERIDLARLDAAFEQLHTTSPSGAILASIDRARQRLATDAGALLDEPLAAVAAATERLRAVPGLHVVEASDPLKLVLALAGTGADGFAVEADLLEQGIRLEMTDRDTLVPLVGAGDRRTSVARLTEALLAAIERRRGAPRPPSASVAWRVRPETALTPREAFFAASERVPAARAVGRVSAEFAVPYPPGVPALAPGEVVGAELLDALRAEAAAGSRIASCADPTLATVRVVAR